MTLVQPLDLPSDFPLPEGFDSPFCNAPAELARLAAEQMQCSLTTRDWQGHNFFNRGAGHMFGVLVVSTAQGKIGYLQGFKGQLAERWQWPQFVPPAFDQSRRASFEAQYLHDLSELCARRQALESDPDFVCARQQLEQGQRRLQQQTAQLQAQLVLRKAARRIAREEADDQTLARLQREGEADARLRAEDKRQAREKRHRWESAVAVYAQQIDSLLVREAALRQSYRERLQQCYQLYNGQGEQSDLSTIFAGRAPLDGVADCAGAKLLNYAYAQRLKPLAMAEFWWGAEPADEVRHHRHFYPSCRGRCRPLFSFMLSGLPAGRQPRHLQAFKDARAPDVVYQDRHLIVVNKPAELLSVPGLAMIDSVQSRLQQRHPDLPELQLVHRLDQSTSGLLLLAKTRRDHKALQRQFSERTISKEYIALLDGEVLGEQGEISLPLRVDLEDRPRQLVCDQHGKPALTRWRVLAREGGRTRVALMPVTGRTHQLRVHMAHALGLSAPIVGDELYGKPGDRLYLHAQSLAFIHPGTGERARFSVPAPF